MGGSGSQDVGIPVGEEGLAAMEDMFPLLLLRLLLPPRLSTAEPHCEQNLGALPTSCEPHWEQKRACLGAAPPRSTTRPGWGPEAVWRWWGIPIPGGGVGLDGDGCWWWTLTWGERAEAGTGPGPRLLGCMPGGDPRWFG